MAALAPRASAPYLNCKRPGCAGRGRAVTYSPPCDCLLGVRWADPSSKGQASQAAILEGPASVLTAELSWATHLAALSAKGSAWPTELC